MMGSASSTSSPTAAASTTTGSPKAAVCPFLASAADNGNKSTTSHSSNNLLVSSQTTTASASTTATTMMTTTTPIKDVTDEELKENGSYIPLVLYQGGMGFNDATKGLLASIGGVERIIEMTTLFYAKFDADQYLRQFLGGMHTPLETHGRRIGSYIGEMMGASGDPWTKNTHQRRGMKPTPLANGRSILVDSRQAAHAAAWNSKARKPEHVGRRFKLDDCRVWMRLMFWACRECGLAEQSPAFFSYFQRWIAHFIPVYEQSAAEFVRAEARWSAKPSRIERYFQDKCVMRDVVGVPYHKAIESLPPAERGDDNWAYQDAISA